MVKNMQGWMDEQMDGSVFHNRIISTAYMDIITHTHDTAP